MLLFLKTEFVCPQCGKVYKSYCGLDRHLQVTHCPSGSWPCPWDSCDQVCKTERNLKDHIKKCHEKTPCTECGRMFTSSRMKEHVNSVHIEDHLKPFVCKICSKGFATNERFRTHMNIHTGNKPFVCKYCGRGFSDKGNMRMHERTTHEGYRRPEKFNRKVTSDTGIPYMM